MNGYDDLSIDKLFGIRGDIAFITGGGDGRGGVRGARQGGEWQRGPR